MLRLLLISCCTAALLLSCRESIITPVPDPGTYTLYVDSETQPCTGVGPQDCLQTRRSPDDEWQLFYDSIDGFEYEPGFRYTLKIRESENPNPPADASSIQYELLELIAKDPVAELNLANTQWRYLGRQIDGVLQPAPTELTLNFDDTRASGNAGCNSFSAGFIQEGARLTFAPIASTKRACLDGERQSQEQLYLQALGQVSSWHREKQRLSLRYAPDSILVFERAEQSLTLGQT